MNLPISFFPLINRVVLCCFMILVVTEGCKNEDDNDTDNNNEQELITTLQLQFTNANDSSNIRTFVFNDPDGDGGLSPTADTISLPVNQNYFLAAHFRDESKTPDIDLTAEIKEEGTAHQVFYTTSNTDCIFEYDDADTNGLPIGLDMLVATNNSVGVGTLTVTLKHQPNGLKNNNIDAGDTDVAATFVLKID